MTSATMVQRAMRGSPMTWRVRAICGSCLTLLLLTAGCGGGGSAERPSVSASVSPTRSVASPTRSPIRSDRPSADVSTRPTGGASRTDAPETPATPSPTARPSPTQPGPTQPSRSAQETSTTPEPSRSGSTAPEPSPSTSEDASAGEGDSAGDDVPAWVWWLVAAVAVGLIVLAVVLVSRRRRRRWRERLQPAEAEVAWLARELLPQLVATGALERVAGGWQVGLPRVVALEDQLTVLEASAPTEADGARARVLRDAVRTARAKTEAVTAGGPDDVWALGLDEAIALLEAVLAPEPHA